MQKRVNLKHFKNIIYLYVYLFFIYSFIIYRSYKIWQ